MSSVVQLERAGAEFYQKLAGETRLKAARDVFQGLVSDEIKHQKDFTDLARTIKGTGLSLDSSINLAEVMSNVVDKLRLIMKGSELVNMDEANLKQALDIGIYNEREAIRIYSELLVISHPGFNVVIRRVVEEEKKHLSALENIKAQRLG
jgi:rubrerythrin